MLKTQVFKNSFRAMRFNTPSTLRMTFLDVSSISYYKFQTALCGLARAFKTHAVKTLVLTAFKFGSIISIPPRLYLLAVFGYVHGFHKIAAAVCTMVCCFHRSVIVALAIPHIAL